MHAYINITMKQYFSKILIFKYKILVNISVTFYSKTLLTFVFSQLCVLNEKYSVYANTTFIKYSIFGY